MLSKIVSKVLVDVGVLGGHREKIFLFVFMVLGFVGGDVGEDIETEDGGGRDGGTGDDIGRTVWNVEEGVVLWVVKDWPSEFGGWGTGDDGLEDAGSDVERAWIVPSIVRAL